MKRVGHVTETGEVVYECEACGARVAGEEAMNMHRTWHRTYDLSEDCPYCGLRFWAPEGHDPLKKHLDWCVAYPGADDDHPPYRHDDGGWCCETHEQRHGDEAGW